MPEENSLIVKLAVPLSIVGLMIVSAFWAYLGWMNTTWASAQEFVLVAKIFAVIKMACALFLLFGYFGKRAGYKQEELDRWGDDALAGKPPL